MGNCCLFDLLAEGAFVLKLCLAINLTTGVWVTTFSVSSPVLIVDCKIFLCFIFHLRSVYISSSGLFKLLCTESKCHSSSHRTPSCPFSLCFISPYLIFVQCWLIQVSHLSVDLCQEWDKVLTCSIPWRRQILYVWYPNCIQFEKIQMWKSLTLLCRLPKKVC